MNDEEILEIIDKCQGNHIMLNKEGAIRLWRMAEEIERKAIARSNAQRIMSIMPTAGEIIGKSLSKEILDAKIAEARASEREKCYKEWGYNEEYKNGWKEGQADLIENGWKILETYNGSALWHSKHFLLILKTASENALETKPEKKEVK
jgi:hypothetical protein